MRKFFLAVSTLFFLISCQSAKDAFTLKKKPSGDEFLVEKKSPLVMPPDYGKLPLPGEDQNIEIKDHEDNDIKVILGNAKDLSSNVEKNSEKTSIEKSILKKIK